MKKSRFSEQQIAFILKQADDGTSVEAVCRKAGVSQKTYYRWRKKYAGLMPSELRRLKQLEEENSRLKRMVPAKQEAEAHFVTVGQCKFKRPFSRAYAQYRLDDIAVFLLPIRAGYGPFA